MHWLTSLLDWLLLLAGIPLLACSAVLLAQVLLARRWTPGAVQVTTLTQRPSVTVLVPAHNESAGIAATLTALRAECLRGEQVLVVADNCSDDTAAIARACGARVSERHDTSRRGKGYALDHGLRVLQADPPDIVVIVDADCRLDPGSLQVLVDECTRSARACQALYLMHAVPGASTGQRIAEFAWRVKNQVRPAGWHRIGAPCQLTGSGMAFPWRLISQAPLASGHLVEDMQLGTHLALAGSAPRYVGQAVVRSEFPGDERAAASQRRRWEHGHLQVLLSAVPRLAATALRTGRPALLAMAADLAVPPLALLVQATVALALAAAALSWSQGAVTASLAVCAGALVALALAVGLAWSSHGRDLLAAGELLRAVPMYALRKLPLYAGFVRRRQSEWVRTKRHGE